MVSDATDGTFSELTGDGKVLVDFWGPRCQPCLALMPGVEALESEFGGAFRVVKVDATANREVCRNLGVLSLPTYLLMRGGEEVSRLTGGELTIESVRTAVEQQFI